MGKKSVRGKEKKLLRKKEIADENTSMQAKQIIVDAANNTDDPLAKMVAFKKFDRNGLNLSLQCSRVKDLDEDTMDWIFKLTKDNMQRLYEEADWGWTDKEKKEEMTEDAAWHIVARDLAHDNKPVACVHFRFDMDEGDAVLYCYEIQLVKEVRRKGLGNFLMKTLELLAFQNNMEKVMLTIFKENHEGNKFFKNKLGYKIDETNPDGLITLVEAMFDDEGYTYEIISKIMPQRKAKPLSQNGANTAAAAVNS